MQVKDINQWVQQILAALPPGLQQLPQNCQQHLRTPYPVRSVSAIW